MGTYALKRILQLIPILLAITFLSFAMMRLAGSDAVMQKMENTGVTLSQEAMDAARKELGLDQPFLTQYARWLGGVLRGDMGKSYLSGEEVFSVFLSKLPATLLLAACSVFLTICVSVPLGILGAVKQNSFADQIVRWLSFLGNSLPNFFVALLLMYFFALRWPLFPVISRQTDLQSVALPAFTLAIAMSSQYIRQEQVRPLLEQCGLPPAWENRYPHELSGGQCQRAAIAQSLIVEPQVLICDEASSALDMTVQKRLLELLSRLREEKGLSLLFICHDLALVQSFCHRVLVMHEGRVVEEGTPDQVIHAPASPYTRQLVEASLWP